MTTLNESARRAAWRMLETRHEGSNGTWQVRRGCLTFGRGPYRVEARHPQFGFLPRGSIRPAGIEGHSMVWQLVTPDHEWLEPVVGDYIVAERVLLEATAGLDELVPADQLTA
ncbi:hypothetical protein K1W54_04375 [Micromonospora sp. CPCC 205371]|nr:hypothetical protein [Micromonospora sp. CPCC 205371]